MLMVVAPSLITASSTRQRKSMSEREPSSGENSTSGQCLRAHRLEVAVRRGRKARLDHVDPHALQGARDAQLLVARHRGARALLAVAHGGVENDQVVRITHGMIPWPLFGPSDCTDCRQEYLARGAQQQAAQREEREREESVKSLLHGTDYTT